MRYLVTLGVMLALGGCTSADEAIHKGKVVCRDGVEYLVFDPGTNFQAVSPHLRRDGTPYPCGDDIQNSTAPVAPDLNETINTPDAIGNHS